MIKFRSTRAIVESTMLTQIRERFESPGISAFMEANLDAPAPTAKITLIAEGPGNKGHRHYYGKSLLENAVASGLFEGKQSYLDHPSRQDMINRPERSVNDLSGWFSDVHMDYRPVTEALPGMPVGYQRGYVVGTLHAETGNAASMNKLREAQTYKNRYPDEPGYVGWSIVGGGTTKPIEIEGEKWNNIEAFTGIDSIDMVTKAGAGGRLISLMEGKSEMFRLFSRKPATNGGGATADQARSAVALHIVEALTATGITPSLAQKQTIEEGIRVMHPELMTPAFIRTLIHEADIDVPDAKETTLTEKLDPEGSLVTLVEAAKKATDDGEPDEDDKAKEAKEKAAKEAQAKADKEKLTKESDIKDPNVLKQFQELTERAVTAETKLAEAERRVEQVTGSVRTVNAKTLMAKTTLSAARQAVFFESVAELPVEQQASFVLKLEEAFGSKADQSGAPALVTVGRVSTNGTRFNVDATK